MWKVMSLDVPSLFSDVLVGETISVIREKLREDVTLGDMTILSPERLVELLEMKLKVNLLQLWRKLL